MSIRKNNKIDIIDQFITFVLFKVLIVERNERLNKFKIERWRTIGRHVKTICLFKKASYYSNN